MNTADDARQEVALANHILAHLGVIDGFGHVSVRDPQAAGRFLIARSMAPALVNADDVLSLDFAGDTMAGETRRSYLERYIHAEIYRARTDVHAIVHTHSPEMIQFGATARPLRPIYHMAACIGSHVPIFEIRESGGPATDMLVRNADLGKSLADTLGEANVVLMRGHGSTVVGANLREAVFCAFYAETNARLQRRAGQLGEIMFLNDEETMAAARANASQVDRAWELWRQAVAQDGEANPRPTTP